MTRYTLALTFETGKPLTEAEIATAQSLVGDFEAADGMPGGRVVDVTVTEAPAQPERKGSEP